MLGRFFDAFNFLVEAQGDATVAQVVAKGLDHFGVGEFQETRTFFNQRNAHAESGEHAIHIRRR